MSLAATRVEKLPLVDDAGRLDGLITMRDIAHLDLYPLATKDARGRLRVGAAIGVRGDYLDRARAVAEAGADVLCLDIAHGHAEHAIAATAELRRTVDIEIIAGNVATAEGAISASTLKRELDEIAVKARSARTKAGEAEDLAPAELTGAATLARERLDDAGAVAARASDEIAVLATTQRRADLVAEGAEKLEGAIGTTALHASNLNNMLKSLHERSGGSTLSEGSLAKGIASWLLGRNARLVPAVAPAPAPVP